MRCTRKCAGNSRFRDNSLHYLSSDAYPVRKLIFLLLVALVASAASAKEYGHYDLQRLLTITETPTGKIYDFDKAYSDRILRDLKAHAQNYPPQFDTPQDKQRAIQDAQAMSGMLDTLIDVPAPDPELLARAAYVNSLAHNLDIPGAAEKASSIFQRLLAAVPNAILDYLKANQMDGANGDTEPKQVTDQKLPRIRFIGERAPGPSYELYAKGWRKKVERVGSLNYPEAVRQKHLYGTLQLTAAIRADGSLESVEITRSSGQPILDDAAKHIVEMSAPFAPFPPSIRKDIDIMNIALTWTFTPADKQSKKQKNGSEQQPK